MSINISIVDLIKIINICVTRITLEGVSHLTIETDLYQFIPTDKWNDFQDDFSYAVGSLKDDWESLQKLIEDPLRVSSVDLDRLASILRAISEELMPSS